MSTPGPTADEESFVESALTVLLHWNTRGKGHDLDENTQLRSNIIKTISDTTSQLPLADSNHSLDDVQGPRLEALEETLSLLRQQLHSYEHSLTDELDQLLSIRNELQTCLSSNWTSATYSRSLVASSLIESMQLHIFREARSIRTFMTRLDTIYSDANTKHASKAMEEVSHLLSRTSVMEQEQFQAAVHGRLDDRPAAAMLLNDETRVHNQSDNDESATDLVAQTTGLSGNVSECDTDQFVDASIASATSIQQVVDTFLSTTSSRLSTALVVGDDGSGKTFACEKIHRRCEEACVHVIRPRLPLDMLGSMVGDVEDFWVSIFNDIRQSHVRCALLLDDLDKMLPQDDDRAPGNPIASRFRCMLFAILDSLEQSVAPDQHVLVVGFAATSLKSFAHRCDVILFLNLPNDQERQTLFVEQFGFAGDASLSEPGSESQSLLCAVTEATVGKTYAELVQLCRQAAVGANSGGVDKDVVVPSALARLRSLKARLSMSIPFSLRSGLIDDEMDVRVLTASDLLSSSATPAADSFRLGLRGQSATEAWDEIVGSIVLPLCRPKEFHELMDAMSANTSARILCGGVLLTGPPLSGKSFLAYSCCRYAASLISSVKVLDVSCTSLIHKEVGGSERAVRRLFDCARRAAPCIVVMDAIENVAAVRGHDTTTEGTLDRILSTLLVELDGVDNYTGQADGVGIAVIGITHDASLIDTALLRPGRLGEVLELKRDWQ